MSSAGLVMMLLDDVRMTSVRTWKMTSARVNVALMMSRWHQRRLGVSTCTHGHVITVQNYLASAWRHVRPSIVAGFPQFDKSTELDLYGTCEITIGASFTTATILAVVLVVLHSSRTVATGPKPETNTKMHRRFNSEWL